MVSSFITGKYELLRYSCKDSIHEKYRSPLIKDYNLVYNKCIDLGVLGCFLSGAGPTIMAMVKDDNNEMFFKIKDFLNDEKINWGVKELCVNNKGAMVFEGDS